MEKEAGEQKMISMLVRCSTGHGKLLSEALSSSCDRRFIYPRRFVPSPSAKEPIDGGSGSLEMMEVLRHRVVERHTTGLGDQVMGRNSIRQAAIELRDSAKDITILRRSKA
jgi:hypothetical protein